MYYINVICILSNTQTHIMLSKSPRLKKEIKFAIISSLYFLFTFSATDASRKTRNQAAAARKTYACTCSVHAHAGQSGHGHLETFLCSHRTHTDTGDIHAWHAIREANYATAQLRVSQRNDEFYDITTGRTTRLLSPRIQL